MKGIDIKDAITPGSIIEFCAHSLLGIGTLHSVVGDTLVIHPVIGIGIEEQSKGYVEDITLISAESLLWITVIKPFTPNERTESIIPEKGRKRKTSNKSV